MTERQKKLSNHLNNTLWWEFDRLYSEMNDGGTMEINRNFDQEPSQHFSLLLQIINHCSALNDFYTLKKLQN